MREQKAGWHYPILKTIATKNVGIEKLVSTIKSHKKYLEKSGKLEKDRKIKLALHINELIEEKIKFHLTLSYLNFMAERH